MPAARLTLYHGTDAASAVALLNGQPLDPATAADRKLDGLPGFYLATHADDAAFFALRRGHRRAAVVRVVLSGLAVERLAAAAGCVLRPIPYSAGGRGPVDARAVVPGTWARTVAFRVVPDAAPILADRAAATAG